jgi:cytochrome d ubiquinol oxidase subunit II
MVMFLAVCLGALYMINNIDDNELRANLRRNLMICFGGFLLMLVIVLVQIVTMEGFAVDADGVVTMEKGKYFHNLIQMPAVLILFLLGAILLVTGVVMTLVKKEFNRGIWITAPGTVMAVMALFMIAAYNGTAYYPSTADIQCSLTLSNSCSSEFTLKTMAIVSLIIPFVVAYIAYFWRQMDKKSLTKNDLEKGEKY